MSNLRASHRRLTVQQAAEQAGVNPETIRRAIRKSELLARRDKLMPGGPLMVDESDFRAWVEKRRNSPAYTD